VATDSRPTVEVDDIPGPDFTVYSEGPPVGVTVPEGLNRSFDGSFSIVNKRMPGQEVCETARGLTCGAYASNYWSTTLRCDQSNERLQRFDYFPALEQKLIEYGNALDLAKFKTRDFLGYCPKGYKRYQTPRLRPRAASDTVPTEGADATSGVAASKTEDIGEMFLNDIYPICKQLYDVLSLDPASSPFGVIAITGATNSSKSLIARGLIFLILEAAAEHALENRIRKPHLVTFEDPIEEYFIKNSKTHLFPQLEILTGLLDALNLDYTPRQKGVDTDSLTSVIKDAKRQTPAVLFVGETRDANDWTQLLDFGSSGHLVVTTAHSGSVVEAMSQILRSTTADTASQRSEVARRIRGIANIRSFTQMVKNPGGTFGSLRTLLPAVWKSTPPSINNLVADGLSSILPALGREEEIGYYGRTHFARALIPAATDRFKHIEQSQEREKDITRKAMEWDIRGI